MNPGGATVDVCVLSLLEPNWAMSHESSEVSKQIKVDLDNTSLYSRSLMSFNFCPFEIRGNLPWKPIVFVPFFVLRVKDQIMEPCSHLLLAFTFPPWPSLMLDNNSRTVGGQKTVAQGPFILESSVNRLRVKWLTNKRGNCTAHYHCFQFSCVMWIVFQIKQLNTVYSLWKKNLFFFYKKHRNIYVSNIEMLQTFCPCALLCFTAYFVSSTTGRCQSRSVKLTLNLNYFCSNKSLI